MAVEASLHSHRLSDVTSRLLLLREESVSRPGNLGLIPLTVLDPGLSQRTSSGSLLWGMRTCAGGLSQMRPFQTSWSSSDLPADHWYMHKPSPDQLSLAQTTWTAQLTTDAWEIINCYFKSLYSRVLYYLAWLWQTTDPNLQNFPSFKKCHLLT